MKLLTFLFLTFYYCIIITNKFACVMRYNSEPQMQQPPKFHSSCNKPKKRTKSKFCKLFILTDTLKFDSIWKSVCQCNANNLRVYHYLAYKFTVFYHSRSPFLLFLLLLFSLAILVVKAIHKENQNKNKKQIFFIYKHLVLPFSSTITSKIYVCVYGSTLQT